MNDDEEPRKKLTPEEVQLFGNQLEWIVASYKLIKMEKEIRSMKRKTRLKKRRKKIRLCFFGQ